jgi:DNA-directed RNA polymerase subunit F
MDNFQLPTIKNVDELKAIFEQYKSFLSNENVAAINSLIKEMEKGQDNIDKDKVQDLADYLQRQTEQEKKNL